MENENEKNKEEQRSKEERGKNTKEKEGKRNRKSGKIRSSARPAPRTPWPSCASVAKHRHQTMSDCTENTDVIDAVFTKLGVNTARSF